jgi:hypothetical protein
MWLLVTVSPMANILLPHTTDLMDMFVVIFNRNKY